jgi:transcriptional regulator with XRE-family HTH domain
MGEMMQSKQISRPQEDMPLDDDTLGGRILHAREAAGLDIKEIAARLGVSAKTVTNWESDRAEPRSNKLSTLAGLLGVSPTWLLAGRGASPREAVESGSSEELRGEVGRIKAEASRLLQRIDSLSEQIASSNGRSAE